VRGALRELGWTGLIILGVFVGLLIGLAVAPELPGWAPWALGIAVMAVFAATLVLKRFRQPH
jgi:small basic protein